MNQKIFENLSEDECDNLMRLCRSDAESRSIAAQIIQGYLTKDVIVIYFSEFIISILPNKITSGITMVNSYTHFISFDIYFCEATILGYTDHDYTLFNIYNALHSILPNGIEAPKTSLIYEKTTYNVYLRHLEIIDNNYIKINLIAC